MRVARIIGVDYSIRLYSGISYLEILADRLFRRAELAEQRAFELNIWRDSVWHNQPPNTQNSTITTKLRALGATDIDLRDSRAWVKFMRLKGLFSDIGETTELETECAICQEPYTDKDSQIQTVCGHRMGLNCLSNWMFKEDKSSCPFCRANLLEVPLWQLQLASIAKRTLYSISAVSILSLYACVMMAAEFRAQV